jgi:hypothetical protein
VLHCIPVYNFRVSEEITSFNCRVSCTLKMLAASSSETSVNINTMSQKAGIFIFTTVKTLDLKYI